MPRLLEAKKDVTSCEKPRGMANTYRSADLRMGQPDAGDRITAPSAGQTRGTETSQYPEEKKTKVIAQVVASERAGAQTGAVTAATGVVGPPTNQMKDVSRSGWKAAPQRVRVP